MYDVLIRLHSTDLIIIRHSFMIQLLPVKLWYVNYIMHTEENKYHSVIILHNHIHTHQAFSLLLYGAEGLDRGVESRCARSLYLFFKDLTMKNCHDAVTVIICLCWLYQTYSKWRATLFTHLVPVVRPSVQWVTFFTSGSYLETWKRKYLYIEKFILWLCYSP